MLPSEDNTREDATSLRELFALCDEIEQCLEEEDASYDTRKRRRFSRRRAALRTRFEARVTTEVPEPLAYLAHDESLELDPIDTLIAMLLLNRRLRDGTGEMTVRELAWALHDNALDVLFTLRRLAPESVLITSGLLERRDSEDGDVLDATLSIHETAMRRLIGDDDGAGRALCEEFADGADAILTLHELALEYQRRAATIYGEGLWSEVHAVEDTVEAIELRIDEGRKHLADRFEATPSAQEIPVFALRRECGLTGLDLVVITTLFGREMLGGECAIEAIDLLRLVSTSERDLLRKRRHFGPDGSLARAGLLVFHEDSEGRHSTGLVRLGEGLSARLLGTSRSKRSGIRGAERKAFHRYLSELENSEDFFRKLD